MMQPIRYLIQSLSKYATPERYLFSLQDMRGLFPDLSYLAFKTLLSRAVKAGYLSKVCRGLYLYPLVAHHHGLMLFHVAAHLRADCFNYISLETVLSEAGVISQIPLNWISIMSSGRSNVISCGKWGSIEFIHTDKQPVDIMDQLFYDTNCKLWRANVPLALRDIKATRRNEDLIDWSVADEFI